MRIPVLRLGLGLLSLTLSLAGIGAAAGQGGQPSQPSPKSSSQSSQVSLAPGYGELQFEAPEPGTYQLPSLGEAGGGTVLRTDGSKANLRDVFGDKIVLLSFIYSSCDDVNGCPLATAVFHKVKSRLEDRPELADRLRLISLSFDPANDTPQVMHLYGASFKNGGLDWQFLTTRSQEQLAPILEAYNQTVERKYDANGNPLGTLHHILRVFLIDPDNHIRNIYNVSFLHPDILIADIKTLMMQSETEATHKTADQAFEGGGQLSQGPAVE